MQSRMLRCWSDYDYQAKGGAFLYGDMSRRGVTCTVADSAAVIGTLYPLVHKG